MVLFIGGSKGGVGKSLMAMIMLYYFINKGERPILIETDTDNPDVLKAYSTREGTEITGKDCDIFVCNLDHDDGWEMVFDIINENPDRPIIINSGARNSMALTNYGDTLNEIEDFKTLWVINQKADSLNLLTRYMGIVQQPICIVKNGYFAPEENFREFDNSKAARAGMESVFLPKATEALTDALYIKRRSLNEISNGKGLTFGQRILARSWLNKIDKLAEDALASAKMVTVES